MNKICTSIEQSQKLMELGIDISTANMYWEEECNLPKPVVGNYASHIHCRATDKDYKKLTKPVLSPAWSLAALLELIPNYVINKVDDKIYANLYYGFKSSHDNLVDAAYEMICQLKENGKI